jgi:hypothetical protein
MIGFLKLWIIRLVIGSSIAFVAKKADNYLDRKYGPDNYDKKIIEFWDAIKNYF